MRQGNLHSWEMSLPLLKNRKGETIGAVLRTRRGVRPVFVSPGYKIDLATCLKIILTCLPKYRIPEPLREAHLLSKGKSLAII